MAGPSVNRVRNFELLSEFIHMTAYDGEIVKGGGESVMPASLAPDDAKYLLDGEWLMYSNNAGQELKYIRPAGATGALNDAEECIYPCFPVYGERGRTDWQALGMAPVILGPKPYIVDTKVFLGEPVYGAKLVVVAGTPTSGHASMSALKTLTPGTNVAPYVVGYCIRPHANNGGRGIRVLVGS